MSVMISLRSFRLSNTSGHCVLVEANKPTMIPSPLREGAIMAGMVDYDAPLETVPTPEVRPTPLPSELPSEGHIVGPFPVVTPAAPPIPAAEALIAKEAATSVEAPAVIEDTGVDDAEALATAVRKLLVRNDPTDFKNDGTPKVVKVVSEMPPECKRPTATQVFAAYEKLQDDPDLAITD